MAEDLAVAPLDELRRRRSAKWRTYPGDVLPLTVAEMDYALAPPIADALHAAVDTSDTGYSMAVPELGRAFADFAGQRWDWTVDPGRVLAVTDVGVGVVELLRVLTRPGDALVINPPVYPPFFDWGPESGVRLHEVPLARDHDGYRLDLAALEAAFATHPAAYLLCNPHNPVGRPHTREELAEVVRLASAYRVAVIADEIHGPLALPGAAYTPLLTVPGAAEIAVSLVSASKAWNLAGLKCGAVVTGSDRMAGLVDRLPPDGRWRTGHFGVIAAVAAFRAGGPWLDQLLGTLDARREQLGQLLAEHLPQVTWHPPEATFLAWLDVSALDMPAPDPSARDLSARDLSPRDLSPLGGDPRSVFLERGRVAVEPGLKFGAAGAGFVRLNFATSPEILDQAVRRMAAAVAG